MIVKTVKQIRYDCHSDNDKFIGVDDVRKFIKEFFVLQEGETNNMLSTFDDEINFDEEWK